MAPVKIEIARGVSRNPRRYAEFEAKDRSHRALADRNCVLHRFAAQAQQTRSILATLWILPRKARNIRPSEWPATKAASLPIWKPASLSNTLSAAMLDAINAG